MKAPDKRRREYELGREASDGDDCGGGGRYFRVRYPGAVFPGALCGDGRLEAFVDRGTDEPGDAGKEKREGGGGKAYPRGRGYVRDKRQDPAVVVLDDGGRFAIALLSGHVGGANAWAERIAGLTGALPVVTTATDGAGAFAVDLFCKERGLRLTDWALAKRVSAAVLAGEPVGFASDFAVEGPLPRGLAAGQASLGIAVTIRRDWQPYPETLALVPPVLALGIGCRRGVDARAIAQAAAHALQSAGLREEAVFAVGTIDRKSDEPGLAEFCRQRGLPMRAFSAQQLAGAPGTVSRSEFVQSVVGVDNVCERAAVLAAEGRLVLPKQKEGPVTVAAALREWRVRFGDQHAGD